MRGLLARVALPALAAVAILPLQAQSACPQADSLFGAAPEKWKTAAGVSEDRYTGRRTVASDWERAFGAGRDVAPVDMLVYAFPEEHGARLLWVMRFTSSDWEYLEDRTLDLLADGRPVLHRETGDVVRKGEVREGRSGVTVAEWLTVELTPEEAATIARAEKVEGRVRRKEFVLRRQNQHQIQLVYRITACP